MTRARAVTRNTALSIALILPTGCGSDSAEDQVGEVGWRFDYRDWTSLTSTPDPRDCANESSVGSTEPYPDIETVTVSASDPDGQVQGFETEFPCEGGAGSTVPIRGVTRAIFDVRFVARAADRTELYRFETDNVDFSGGFNVVAELLASVGELEFRPQIEGSSDCDPNISSFRVRASLQEGGVVTTPPAVDTTFSTPCAGSFLELIELRNIPVMPTTGFGGFILPRYEFFVEAQDSTGNSIACSRFERAIPPGAASAVGSDPNLTLTQCD